MTVYPGVIPGASYNPIPPAPPYNPFTRLQIDWEGADGSHWDLSRPQGGIFLTADGLRGLSWPTFELGTSSSPARAGRRRRSARVTERVAEIPIYIYGERDSEEFLERWTAFQNSWHPLNPGRLVVTTPQGTRHLQLYFDADGEETITTDPLYYGFSRVLVQATAEDRPYWEGPQITGGPFVSGNPDPFFSSDGNLYIAESGGLDSAILTNPGDVAAWPVWTIRNTEPSQAIKATIVVDGGTIIAPSVGSGRTLTIDTDTGRARYNNGVNAAGDLEPYDPRPIPAQDDVPLELSITGFGRISVSITPRYWRAF